MTLVFIATISVMSIRGFLRSLRKVRCLLRAAPRLHCGAAACTRQRALWGPGRAPSAVVLGVLARARAQIFKAVKGSAMASHLVLLLTQVTGAYSVSSLLLIRKNVPLKYRCVEPRPPLFARPHAGA